MRWSLFFLVTLLAVLIADVAALPTPQDASSDLSLERRALGPRRGKRRAKSGTSRALRAADFKKASSTYRNAALKSKNAMYSLKNGKLVKSKAPKKMPKGRDADHIFEAQTMKYAAQKAGYSLDDLAHVLPLIKNRINDPKNMAFLDPATNRAKGKAHTAIHSGKTPVKDGNVVQYFKHTSPAGKCTASDLDEICIKNGITGMDVSGAYNKVLKAIFVKKDKQVHANSN